MELRIIQTMIALSIIIAITVYVGFAIFAVLLQERGFRLAQRNREYWGRRFTLMGMQHRQQMTDWRREAREDRELWEKNFKAHRQDLLTHRREFREISKENQRIIKDTQVLILMIRERLDIDARGDTQVDP